jgi:hypothetical protein
MSSVRAADRVKETSTSTGTGNFTLAGAVAGFRAFEPVFGTGTGNKFWYTIVGGTSWETGIGYMSTNTVLVRDLVLASSNLGAEVNFGAGDKQVFATIPASIVKDPLGGEVLGTPAIASGVLTLDLSLAGVFKYTANANVTSIVISNPAPSAEAQSFVLIRQANGTGFTTTWPSSVKWATAQGVPTLSSTNGHIDIIVFTTVDGGATWWASPTGLAFA